MFNSSETTVSTVGNVNELITFNAPAITFVDDTAKREEIRALSPDEQIRWANTKMDNLRNLTVITNESVELASKNVASLCMALYEVISADIWQILGYDSVEECINTELNLKELGKIQTAREQVSNTMKVTGQFSNRVIATVLGVAETTVRRDIKRSAVQLRHDVAVAHPVSSSGHGDQRVLSMDGKYRIDKRDDAAKMRDFLEFAYLARLKDKSLREIEELTHTPFRTVSNTLGLPDVGDFFHEQVTRLFVRVRRMEVLGLSRGAIAEKLKISVHGIEYLTSPDGWLSADNHQHFFGESFQKIKTPIYCMLDPVSVKAWAASEGQAGRDPLRMNDSERSLTTVSEIALLLGQQQSNVTYHLNHWKTAVGEDASAQRVSAYVEQKTSGQAEDQTQVASADRVVVDAESTVVSEEGTVVRDRVKASGWRFVLADVYNRMTGIQKLRMFYSEHKMIEPETLGEKLETYALYSFYLLDSDKTFEKSECSMLVKNATHLIEQVCKILQPLAMISDFARLVPASLKQKIVEAIDDLITVLQQVRHAFTSEKPVSYGMSGEELRREREQMRERDEINELMQNMF